MTARSKTLWIVALCVALTTAAVLILSSSRFQIRHHTQAMQRALDETYAAPDTVDNGLVGYTLGETYDRYTYHRQRLIELGAVRERNFVFKHLRSPTDQSSHLIKLMLSSNRPEAIDWESPHPSDPEPMQLTVWCFTGDSDAWDAFVEKHDVPDYRTRFMASPTE
jgi:hypothetical protein